MATVGCRPLHTEDPSMTDRDKMHIIGVSLLDSSAYTYRVLHNQSLETYPVIITLSRPAGTFERKYLAEQLNVIVNDVDRMRGLILETTLEKVWEDLNFINENIGNVAESALAAADFAAREDARLAELAAKLDAQVAPRGAA
jgi:hypothetical protein